MTPYASTSCLARPEELRSRIERMRAAGITRIELSQSIIPPGPVARWLDDLRTTGCHFLVHNYFPPPPEPFVLNLASPDGGVRARSLDLVRRAIDLSAALGAPFYSVHAGFVNDPYAFGTTHFLFKPAERADARERANDRFLVSVTSALDAARSAGIDLLIENNNTPPEFRELVLLRDAVEVLGFFAEVNDPRLGLLLDTGHLHVAANALGFDGTKAVRALRPHIRAIHLHDNDGTADYHRKAAPEGWALSVLAGAMRSVPPIVVEAHCATAAELREHIESLQGVLEFSGHD